MSRIAVHLLITLALGGVVVGACGCDSVDPTEQFMSVTFKNDLHQTIVFTECRTSSCSKFDDSWTLTSGRSAVDLLSDRGGKRTWIVRLRGGPLVGCIRLMANRWYRRLGMNVSAAEPCTSSRVLSPLDIEHSQPPEGVRLPV